MHRIIEALVPPNVRSAADYTADVRPPSRPAGRAGGEVPTRDAATIPAVYRALSIISTSVSQLPLVVERQGVTLTGADVPALVRKPSVTMSRSDWLEAVTISLAVDGNAFIHKVTAPGSTEVLDLAVWSPHDVHVWKHPRTGRITYTRRGKDYSPADVAHLHLQRLPGQLRGLGPIQAAQPVMRVAVDMRDYMGDWFRDTGQPPGVLTSDQVLTGEDARVARNAWNNLDATGQPIETTANPSRIKVLGKGTRYEPILLKPRDAMWLDAQNFSTLEVARLLGVPSSLMLAAIEGNSQTYSNVEQEWLAYVRFGLMAYLRKIEEALTHLTPLGQTVRFNIDALLRSDTKTRYQAHDVAIRAGFLTVDEVRHIEGLPALTADQRAEITAHAPQPAAAKETAR